jgi:hypothetical protein
MRTAADGGVFGSATEDDVSLFFYIGHGFGPSDDYNLLGPLCGVDNHVVTPTELRNALDAIDGKKIVILDSCHSGNMIGKDGETLTHREICRRITNSIISAFAGSRSDLAANDYYVIVSAHSSEISWSSDESSLFIRIISKGSGYDMVTGSYLRTRAETTG